jgi:hypothetical protein
MLHPVTKQPVITSVVRLLAVFLFAWCSFSAGLNAQDIYTSRNLPSPKLDYTIEFARPDGVVVQPGGLNSLWDYRNLVRLGQREQITAFQPEDISGLKPPGTNVVLFNFATAKKTFLSTSPISIRYLGEDDGDIQLVVGREPLEVDPLPIQFNQTISVNYNGQITSRRSPDSVVSRIGRYSLTADGNGRLQLPGIVNPFDCIRITITEDITDTVFVKDEPQYLIKTKQDKTIWYGVNDAIEHLVIIQGDVTHEQIQGEVPKDFSINTVYYSTSQSQTANSVDESMYDSILLYPNPADNGFTIRGELQSNSPMTIKLYSTLGELILTQTVEEFAVKLNQVIPTEKLPSGGYILVIEQSGSSIRRRLQIVH